MALNEYHKERSRRIAEAISKQPPMTLEMFIKQFDQMNPNWTPSPSPSTSVKNDKESSDS